MKEKAKKITYMLLLILFLPMAIYLLAIKAFLQFFVFAIVMSILIRILKKQWTKSN